MGSQLEKKIGNEIRAMALQVSDNTRFTIMTGVVIDVNEGEMECKVQLTLDNEGDYTDGVTLNVTLENKGGMYMIPVNNSDCFIIEIDGPGKWEMLKASKYSKIIMQADNLIQLNDGSLGGLTKTKELKEQLDKNNALLSHIVNVINSAPIPEPGSGSPSALQAALQTAIETDELGDFSDIENKNITHG